MLSLKLTLQACIASLYGGLPALRFRQRAWHGFARNFCGEVRVRARPRSLSAPTATGARGRASDFVESQRIDYRLVCIKYLFDYYVSHFHLV